MQSLLMVVKVQVNNYLTVLFKLSCSFVREFNIRESNFSAFNISKVRFPRHVITA